jgi:hypothetical protein
MNKSTATTHAPSLRIKTKIRAGTGGDAAMNHGVRATTWRAHPLFHAGALGVEAFDRGQAAIEARGLCSVRRRS